MKSLISFSTLGKDCLEDAKLRPREVEEVDHSLEALSIRLDHPTSCSPFMPRKHFGPEPPRQQCIALALPPPCNIPANSNTHPEEQWLRAQGQNEVQNRVCEAK